MVHAEAEEADGTPAQAEGEMPARRVPTGGAGERGDQPDPAGMGALLCCGGFPPRLWLAQRWGGKEGAAASEACTEPKRLRREEGEEAGAVRRLAVGEHLPGESATAESAPSARGPITLDMKHTGKRRAGNPHAACDEAGAGNVTMVAL